MKTLYVGCALRGAPQEFVDTVVALKGDLETDFSVLHFVGISPDAPVRVVYETDISLAAEADLGRATIVAYREGADISRMVVGLIEVTPAFSLFVYEDFAEVREYLRTLA